MYIQSLSPSLLISQPPLRGFDSEKHHHQHKELEHAGLNKRQDQLTNDLYQPIGRVDSKDTRVVGTSMSVQSVAASQSHSADIQIKTKQGDIVTISLSQSISTSRNAFNMEQGDSKISVYGESMSAESRFNMSIEGDLNKDELKSLNQLMKKMNKVSHHFFNGNIETAFKHAKKVGFDTQQIASFSLDLSRERSVQAVVAYQQTTMPEQDINTDMLKQAKKFLVDTKEFMADTKSMLDSYAEPKQSFTDLLAGMGRLQNSAQEQKEDSSAAMFLTIIENISDEIFEI